MDPSQRAWERMSKDEVRRLLACDYANGLHTEEVTRRQELYGKNILERETRATIWSTIRHQFESPLVLILAAAAVVTFILGEHVDSVVIALALLINVVIGTFQEERAGKAFEKLNASQERHAIVIREGKRRNILTSELVPGDIVVMEGGFFVPADLRIVEEKDLRINEASLTGEWLAVDKAVTTLDKETPLAEQVNMAWMGTLIESGYGKGVVVATGNRTQIGEIAASLGTIDDQITPLQHNIRKLAHRLSYAIAVALVAILVIGLLRGEPIREMIFVAIAVAVAAIPTGLPAAVTIVLAIGMETILKRGGLVRNLLAAETLGGTTIILTDKTGTLTQARMKLASLHSYQAIRDHFVAPKGDNQTLLELAVLGSDAFIEEKDDAPNKLTVHGRAVEKAIVIAGLEAGIAQDHLLETYPRMDYLQFSSTRRFSASLNYNPHKKTNRLIFNGEPERLLEGAVYTQLDGKRSKLTDHERKRLTDTLQTLASEGKRLIGVAYRDATIDKIPEDDDEARKLLKNVIFAGFVAFEDPVREDVVDSITEVRQAGAQVLMLTGDNPETAHHIAQQVGITRPGDELVIRGSEIDAWDDAELYMQLQSIRVIARAVPAHKLRIARVLKNNGEIVAMTGDGINDSPALRAASIGVAVGSGTEVAKEASDLVLIDNSFSVIVAAIEEGRRIIDNLKKIVAYLLSTSFSEIVLIAGALVGGGPLPLLPVQILWANIVGGDLMSFAFAFEKGDRGAMKRDPRSTRARNILTRELTWLVVILAVVTGLFTILLYYYLWSHNTPIAEIQTMMFVALSLDSLFFSLSLKSFDTPIWRINPMNNKYLLGALAISILLLFLALVFPPMQTLLSLVPLTATEKFLLVVLGVLNLLTIEVLKYLMFGRRLKKRQQTLSENA